MQEETAIKISNLKKQYRLGTIGAGTLSNDLKSWWARKRGKEDPNSIIGTESGKQGASFWALNGINLEIKKGEAVGIIGMNGAGKSTLLKILSRVTAPTEGDIWINGKIASMLEVGTGFHAELTGRENIYLNGAILGMTRAQVDQKIEDIIEFSECRQFIDTPVKRYSSGMYVKLAFSVAAHLDADILVMDEVLAVGDMKFQNKCLKKMGDAANNEGKTVLYVSHNMSTIRRLCNRCIVLKKGEVIFDGSVDDAIERYMDNNQQELKSEYDFRNKKRTAAVYGKRILLNRFSFIDKGIPRFGAGEKLGFEIEWEGLDDIEDLRIRLDFHYADSSMVAISESKAFTNVKKGDKGCERFEVDISVLAEGRYYFRVLLFTLNQFGVHAGVDESAEFVYFEVADDNKDRTLWQRQYWGSVRLHDIEVCE